ncbi:hypothetical protein ULF88_09180 [Halopseudomonas pachastrellae]|nr:hypothetical protein [Halopseudomonas pachastrellae]
MLEEACRQLRGWRDAGYDVSSVAVNMSGFWMERGDIVGRFSRRWSATHCRPSAWSWRSPRMK